jgi:sialidase-1
MPLERLSRRRLAKAAACTAVALSRRAAAAAPSARVEDLRVISWKEPLYHGWPTLTRRTDGELLLAFSGGRETHVCPFGRVELMRSKDGGETWLWPRVLLDGPIDDRDAGVVETRAGSILVTTFTSLAYEPILEKAAARPAGSPGAWEPGHLAEWQAVHGRLTPEGRRAELGTWMLRSTDGGVTFSARYAVPVNSPHGPAPLADGRLLYCGVELWKPERRVGACLSDDDGLTWRWLATIPNRPGDDSSQYHELHAVETADGRLVAQIRNHNAANRHETLQTESDDGGRTWSVPHGIGVWGYPSHLLRLADGRLLMTYGHRRPPIGNQARLSEDGGRTWSEAIPLTTDAANGDMGYPSTVERADGRLVTVWYEQLASRPEACLRQAIWRLG